LVKIKLLLFTFLLGLVLLAYSWWVSFPVSLVSSYDVVFSHISPLYWLSLAILITSMYLLAVNLKTNSLKWLLTVGIVLVFFSLSYFFILLPGSDSPYFRGFMDYFLKTDSLDTLQLNHSYFQWPAFFILTKTGVSLSGLSLSSIEFTQFAIIGLLFATTLYVYSSVFWKNGSPLSILVFFIIGYAFLNYQDVPFSLAFALLFVILLVLENKPRSTSVLVATIIIFTSISFMHLFVPLFYILYLAIMTILKRNKQYGILLLSTIAIYSAVQVSLAARSLEFYINGIFTMPSDFSSIVNQSIAPIANPLDNIVQIFTRTVTVSLILTSFLALIILFSKHKLRSLDKAIFITGLIYSVVGIAVYTLGMRAVPLLFVPACLGTYYFFGQKNGAGLKFLFIILLVCSISIPVHTALSNPPMMFQTSDGYSAANFLIERYDWSKYHTVLLDTGTLWYIYPQVASNTSLVNTYSPSYQSNLNGYDCIVYSLSLQNELQGANVTAAQASVAFNDFSTIYNSGNFGIYVKTD
jgi:hypothetical protein